MINKKNIEVLIEEFQEAEKIRGRIPMLPVVVIHETCDYRFFKEKYRDYFWFDEKQETKEYK